jgi:hypothetical protein
MASRRSLELLPRLPVCLRLGAWLAWACAGCLGPSVSKAPNGGSDAAVMPSSGGGALCNEEAAPNRGYEAPFARRGRS